MLCEYCGHPLDAGGRICRACGMLVTPPTAGSGGSMRLHDAPFFPVATHKFLLLSICSLNLYLAYWFYQNWRRVRDRSGEPISPLWRAIFAPVWIIPLLLRITHWAREHDVPVWWNAPALGACFILMSFLSRLPDPWWLLAIGSSLALVPVVQTSQRINRAGESPEELNDRYSSANVATIIVGGLFLALVVVVTLTNDVGTREPAGQPAVTKSGNASVVSQRSTVVSRQSSVVSRQSAVVSRTVASRESVDRRQSTADRRLFWRAR